MSFPRPPAPCSALGVTGIRAIRGDHVETVAGAPRVIAVLEIAALRTTARRVDETVAGKGKNGEGAPK